MTGDSAEIKLRASLDPAAATEGANKVVKDVKGISEATDRASEGGKKLVEQLGSMRSAHHALEGIANIAEGGAASLAGMAMEARVLTEAFEAMIPGAGPLLAILTGLAIGGEMFATSQDSAEKATDKAADATARQAKKIEELQIKAAAAYPDILRQIEAITKAVMDQVAAQRELEKANQELADAKISERLADLDEEEAIEMGGKDADQQAAIKRDFAKKRLALKQELELQKAEEEKEDRESALKALQTDLETKQREAAALSEQLTHANNLVNGDALKKVSNAGVKSNAQMAAERREQLRNLNNQLDITGSRRGLSSSEQVEFDKLTSEVPRLAEEERIFGPSFTQQQKTLEEKKKKSDQDIEKFGDPSFWTNITNPIERLSFKERYNQAREESEALQKQLDAIDGYNAELNAAKSQIKDNGPKWAELNGAIDAIKIKLDAAGVNVARASENIVTLKSRHVGEQVTEETKNKEEQAQRDFENREAKRKAQIDTLDAQINAATDETMKAVLERQKAALESTGIQDKAKVDLSTGKIGQAQYDEAIARASATTSNAESAIAKQQTAQGKKDQATDNRETEQELKAVRGQIEATGNKQLIQEAKQIMETVLDKHLELAMLQRVFASGVNAKFQNIDQVHHDFQAQIDALKRQ